MSTVLKLKRSTTTGASPANLSLGELAINIPDKKIWIGDASEQPVLISEYGIGGSGETYYEGLGINIDTNNTISIDVGQGISVDTNNGVNLDLSTIPRIDSSIAKSDYLPFWDVSHGTTDLVKVTDFIRSTLYLNVSTQQYDGVPSNDEFLQISIQDNNANSFRISTAQNSKNDIMKIDTQNANASVYINGTSFYLNPSVSLEIASGPVQTNILSEYVYLPNCTQLELSGAGEISGVTTISTTSGNLYITGNLIVSGFVETDVGIRGGTDVQEEYLGVGMILDGGTYS